ncbi:hypothetical protein ELH77_31405 (plasmid) [Rhizobium ruizarguesonis]|uniref:hypothetical protein n=1 Tax=Rhizobium ruizarguesonis TaxID=2081791 RepID=UPI001030AD4A|nr:hypothetical protein [Rhizobium ruizarguesonis]TAT94633.1 hypothetical protein ELI53_30605 [Rhizobium ruizarguesonis]TAZ06303.1 hypothetical protein ELH77_31405 [Rhizobium ruizarguesonis]TBD94258.1 hypothetical protein ELH10_32575 [Rhizobium ruizarguesonis]TBF04613.1 hypothetical protein ELG95_30295 [Rhizobium ruizarguesonis]
MTNFHCGGTAGAVEDYWSDDVCHHTIVDFSWDGDTMITGVRIASFQQQKKGPDWDKLLSHCPEADDLLKVMVSA